MNILNAIARSTYFPLCRAYSRRFVKDGVADSVLLWLTSVHFWRVHGYWPDFRRPRSFEEKVNARMLFDRDPRWTLISDKLSVRDYVSARVGTGVLVPLLWTGLVPESIPFDKLPDQFVMKANHGCGYNIIVGDKSQINMADTISKLNIWLGENFCHDYVLGTAWAYRNVSPAIMIESFIGNKSTPPCDYKFFCFGGKVESFKVDLDRFTAHSAVFFDRGCRPLDVHEKGLERAKQEQILLPKSIHDMVEIAESLAEGFDFIRVDLYNVGDRIYFGELTCYPSGGMGPWEPVSYDYFLGSKWEFSSPAAIESRPESRCV